MISRHKLTFKLNILQLLLLICFFSLNVTSKVNSNLSPTDIANLLANDNNLFDSIISEVQNKLSQFQFKETPPLLLAYKSDFKRMIMSRAGINTFDSNTNPNNFFSFLTVNKIPDSDNPFLFFGTGSYETLIDKIPLSGQGVECWSGSYWPMKNGLISVRYDLSSKNTIGVFDPYTNKYTRYFTYSQSVSMYSQPNEYKSIDPRTLENYINMYYSPSEKLDYLLGHYDFPLTNHLKIYSSKFASNGDMPSWYGICHGWAPASYFYPNPTKPIVLTSVDGKKITFLPDDLKAIFSLFWANSSYTTRFVGSLCPYSKPQDIKSDPNTGLYIDEKCSSVNPGTLLIVCGNQMGIKKLNFMLDPAADNEIWNQPVRSYTVRYFNLLTRLFYSTAFYAHSKLSDLKASSDKFLKFVFNRATTEVTYVVGVVFSITYAVENPPVKGNKSLPNSFKTDQSIAAIYLDRAGNIVGGEWMFNNHPNFLWKFNESVAPGSAYDYSAPTYDGTSASLSKLSEIARKASQNGVLLKTIVDYFSKMSLA